MKKEIIQTLIYGDIFEYPLTAQEIWRFLIAEKKVKFSQIAKELSELVKGEKVASKGNFYFLPGRSHLVSLRQKRNFWSRKKIKIAYRVAHWLYLIPTVKMVAISGALAMKNSDKNDDIDLLVVSSKNRLWLTRLLATFLVELVARRRHPSDKEVCDKICLNVFLEETYLAIPPPQRDLFTAHEVCQLKPIWDKDNTHIKFLQSNLWVRKFLPNSVKINKLPKSSKKRQFLGSFFDFLENLVFKIQLAYMKSRRTTEVVEKNRIFFHPKDCRNWVLKKYKEKLQSQKMI